MIFYVSYLFFRFFASQPKTYSDGSDDSNKHDKSSSGDDYQGSTSGSGNGSGIYIIKLFILYW